MRIDGCRTTACVVAGAWLPSVGVVVSDGLVDEFDADLDERSQDIVNASKAQNGRKAILAFQLQIANRKSQIRILQV
jgi:hypothetical protein